MTTDQKIQLIGQKIWVLSRDLERYHEELESLKKQMAQLTAQHAAETGSKISFNTAPPVTEPKERPVTPAVEHKKPTPEPVKEKPVETINPVTEPEKKPVTEPVSRTPVPPAAEPVTEHKKEPVRQPQPVSYTPPPPPPRTKNLEEYIGGNILAKVGIVVLVIGIAIGVKYAIDNELISELTRIVLAYAAGGTLLGFAFYLRKKYEAFSAVLLSGGVATLYFTTFGAYTLYGMFGQVAAFGIMVIVTIFTVFAATVYNQQWIGIFGLVGAYAIPMLLDNNSGRAHILFIYMSIINAGVLVLSFRKYWRLLTHLTYALSWMIFAGWFYSRYDADKYATTALVFSFVFFITFYISFIAYKTIRKEQFNFWDIILVLMNSFIYFGFGYLIVSELSGGRYLGLFTLGNALVHLAFAYSVYRNKQVDRKLFYLIMALMLGFATMAIPVQLDGHWVTLFWLSEMFLLFWIGRTKNIRFYEWMGFVMVGLGLASLLHDWMIYFRPYYDAPELSRNAFFNVTFLSSLIGIASLAGMIIVNTKYPLPEEERKRFEIYSITDKALPVLLALLAYFGVYYEICYYFDAEMYPLRAWNTDGPPQAEELSSLARLNMFKALSLIGFTSLYVVAIAQTMRKVWRDPAIVWGMFSVVILITVLAVPMNIEKSWLTLFWLSQLLLLFCIGRIRQIIFYEWAGYTLVLLSAGSLIMDWGEYFMYPGDPTLGFWTPIANRTFLNSILAIASYSAVLLVNKRFPTPAETRARYGVYSVVEYVVPVILIIVTYFAFYYEIATYFDARVYQTAASINASPETAWGMDRVYDDDLLLFKNVWLINYTMFFIFLLGGIVRKLWRDVAMEWTTLILEIVVTLVFLGFGLHTLSTLRDHYLEQYNANYFLVSGSHIYMRYISFAFIGLLMYNLVARTRWQRENPIVQTFLQPFLHFVLLTILSSELTNIIVLNNPEDPSHYIGVSRKTGYTVLWGLYSFVLIALGIMRKNKALRISGIVLFGITLIKLVSWDIIDLSTGYKIVAFITFGVILLVVAFLYQKFKNLIFGDDEPS